jgi:tetratricopeptide (TPR) repeat protein
MNVTLSKSTLSKPIISKATLSTFCLFSLFLQACTSTPDVTGVSHIEQYFHDEHFSTVEHLPVPEDLFSLPDEAVKELKSELQRSKLSRSKHLLANEWLAKYINAEEGAFEYRDNVTLVASETFGERAGNCLSLVLLTATLAKELDVVVEFQEIDVPPVWDKQGGFYLVNGHINLKLLPPNDGSSVQLLKRAIQVDFLPERAVRGYAKRKINKQTVIAMFYNNVAAESLVVGDYDKAYGFLKLGLLEMPNYVPALNTLAVLYRYKGLNNEAEALYKLALEMNNKDMTALYNYAVMLGAQDRLDEWAVIHKQLELERIDNPYYYYGIAQQAYLDKEYQDALLWYKRAVAKADYRHEFYFGLSKAYWKTGDERRAEANMLKALALTHDEGSKLRYQSKLHAMKSH